MSEPIQTIKSYADGLCGISKEAFVRLHGHPFLVERRREDKAAESESSFNTVVMSTEQLRGLVIGGGVVRADQPVRTITKQATGVFSGMISVGRTRNNDLVMDSKAVSKFHAHFGRDASTGEISITDANSTNGTFVNGRRLVPKVRMPLHDGDLVSFSADFDFVYYSPEGFYGKLGSVKS